MLEKFRARATPSEIDEFERLNTAGGLDNETKAMELVLFKLKTNELYQIGITQIGSDDGAFWYLASSTKFADEGKAFERARARVGVSPGGVLELGIVGWTVPRKQFFIARSALLNAGLSTNEITIIEPRFALR